MATVLNTSGIEVFTLSLSRSPGLPKAFLHPAMFAHTHFQLLASYCFFKLFYLEIFLCVFMLAAALRENENKNKIMTPQPEVTCQGHMTATGDTGPFLSRTTMPHAC